VKPTIISIQVGLPADHGDLNSSDEFDQPWRSGFFKYPIDGPVHVGKTNIDGDGQADLRVHGGPDKAILCYSADHYPYWKQTLGLIDFPFGAFGENLTIANLTEQNVCIGDVWSIGSVRLQVSQPRQPCWKLANRWRMKDLPFQVIANGKSGWYVRVMQEGSIQPGQEIIREERPIPDWSIARANHLMFHDPDNANDAHAMAEMNLLAESWRRHFTNRAAQLSKR
jgi:MOSC domain-containing protein YiiM